MQSGQGAFDNPAEDAEAAAMRTAGLGGHRTLQAPWTPRTRPPPSLLVMTLRTDKRRRACAQLGLTRYSQPLPLAGFSNVRQSGNRKSSENHCINTDLWWALVDDLGTLPLGTFSEGRDSDFNSGVGDAELFRQHRQTGISRPQFQAPDQRRRQ